MCHALAVQPKVLVHPGQTPGGIQDTLLADHIAFGCQMQGRAAGLLCVLGPVMCHKHYVVDILHDSRLHIRHMRKHTTNQVLDQAGRLVTTKWHAYQGVHSACCINTNIPGHGRGEGDTGIAVSKVSLGPPPPG